MKKAFPFILTMLTACTGRSDDNNVPKYDDALYALAEKAASGDLDAAYAGRARCSNTLKIDQVDYPGLYLGKCGGFEALIIQNAIMSGDAEKISTALNWKKLDKYPKRKAFYLDIAKYRIQKRCTEKEPPASCKDKKVMKGFGL
jgi:hypothetical protein